LSRLSLHDALPISLLIFQAVIYANAAWAGASAEGVHLTPLRRAYRTSAQSTGARPGFGSASLAIPFAAGVVAIVLMALISLATPPAPPEPQGTAPAEAPAAPIQRPSPSPSSSPSPSASPSPKASGSPSPVTSPSSLPAGSTSPTR